MTLSRLEDLQLRVALLAQQLVELPRPSPAEAEDLLQRLARAVRDLHEFAPAGEPLADLRLREIQRLMTEAATLTHDEPRWRSTLLDLHAALDEQAFEDRRHGDGDGTSVGEAATAL